MNFKNKYMLRNKSISALSWFCGLTGLMMAYIFIKWMKVTYYNHRMFENVYLDEWDSISWLFDNYFQIGGFSILWYLLLAIVLDLLIRKFAFRNKF